MRGNEMAVREHPDDCPATALARYVLDARLAVEEGREMPCPAAGGLLCGSDHCLKYGCEEEGS